MGGCPVWPLCTDLRRQTWHSGCSFYRWLGLVHLEWWHGHIMLVQLTDLQSLLEDVFVRKYAHVRIVTILLLLLNNHLLSLVNCHLLDYVRKQLDCFVGWEHLGVNMFVALSSIIPYYHSVSAEIQSAFHEFTSLNWEFLAPPLDLFYINIDVPTDNEEVWKLVNFELHLRDLEVDLL